MQSYNFSQWPVQKKSTIFIFKFNQLWKDGFAADMNFKCYAGQEYATLHVGLGCHPKNVTAHSGSHDSKHSKHVTPSQQRRRVRCENARKFNECNSAGKADIQSKIDRR